MTSARSRSWFHLPRSLVWRVAIALVAVQLTVAAVILWQGYRNLLDQHLDDALDKLERINSVLCARYAEILQNQEWARLDAIVKDDGERARARITVILEDGQVVADSSSDPATMENHARRPEVVAALASGNGTARRVSGTTSAETIYRAVRIVIPASEEEVDAERARFAIVRSALALRDVRAEFWSHARVLGGTFIAAILATLLIFVLISRGLGAQVRDLSQGAARFAAGNLAHRIREPAANELATLARSLNEMAALLGERLRTLDTQERELRAILQSMSNGVLALDGEQRILMMNRAAERLLGVKAVEAHTRLLQEVVRQPELHRIVARELRSERSHADDGSPNEFTFRGGARVEVTIERLHDSSPHAGLLILLNDVTHLRRLETLRSDFAANVSHELRTPITNIQGYVETLMHAGFDDREQAQRFLAIVRRNSDRLAAIVDDVMALSRLEQGSPPIGGPGRIDEKDAESLSADDEPPRQIMREELARERVSLRAILAGAIAQHQKSAASKSMAIELSAEPSLTARVHAALLEQAVSNLIGNAINYSPPRTRVKVSVSHSTTRDVVIAVQDEGPGIAKEHHERIFERFYRIDKGRSREQGGTGLGLSIVKHIARAHGGTVSLESEVGKGSTFRITLPSEVRGQRSEVR